MLLARIATARAKPNGQCWITRECALQDLASLDVEELPGVGWRMGQKLREEGFYKIKDIQGSSEKRIQQILGNKTGSLVFNFAYGCDDRSVSPPVGRKSIGAEVNWGVRFQSNSDTNKFLFSICNQISERMKASSVKGKSLTIKIKRKKSGWTEPAKYLGMGSCDSLSKTVTLQNGVRDTEEIYSESKILLDSFQLHFSEIRGMGISVSKLEETSSNKKSPLNNRYQRKIDSLPLYSKKGTENTMDIIESDPVNGKLPKAKPKPGVLSGFVAKRHVDPPQTSKFLNSKKSLHNIDAKSIDKDVLEELPIEIRREIEVAYGTLPNHSFFCCI
jgi:DNA repair protein REV1